MEKFLEEVAEILEVDAVSAGFKFREVADWDSMKGFSLMVLLENDYGKPITVDDFLACETVGDLAKFAGLAG